MASRSNVTIKRATGFIYASSFRKIKKQSHRKSSFIYIFIYVKSCVSVIGFHGFTIKCDDKRATGFIYASSVRKIKSKAIENLECSFEWNGYRARGPRWSFTPESSLMLYLVCVVKCCILRID